MTEVRWTVFTGPGTADELVPQLEAAKASARLKAAAEAGVRMMRYPLPLGDLVERYAKPIAVLIDRETAALGTDADCLVAWVCRGFLKPSTNFAKKWATKFAEGCTACSKRRKLLNRIVGNVRDWREWWGCWRRLWPAWREVYVCPKKAAAEARAKAALKGA